MLTGDPSETAVHCVFRNAAGKLMIEMPRLLVRFKARLKREEVFAALGELGLRPLRAWGFVENLFECRWRFYFVPTWRSDWPAKSQRLPRGNRTAPTPKSFLCKS